MSIRKCLSGLLITVSLTLFALPAAAVTFDGVWNQNRTVYSAGTSFMTLPASTKNHFCYLSRVAVEETDRVKEAVSCVVNRGVGNWLLTANKWRDGNSKVYCSATCYSY